MNIKGGNFLEKHIEKLVLAVVGIVCLWILFSRVLISPNKVQYDYHTLDAGEIDRYIGKLAKELEVRLSREPETKEQYNPMIGSFDMLLNGKADGSYGLSSKTYSLVAKLCPSSVNYAINNIKTQNYLSLPPSISPEVTDNRKYNLPEIGRVADVSAEHIRAAVFVPVADVDLEHPYKESGSEVNDLDFVTVVGKFDVSGLVESFNESFAGVGLLESWRDPCLAKPVFAAVQLQRCELLEDGSWGEWEKVPRTRINAYKEMFNLEQNVQDMAVGGIELRMFDFRDPDIREALLQPDAYRIASMEEEWFPPSLHKEFLVFQSKLETQERREALEKEKKEDEDEPRGSGFSSDSRYGRYGERRTGRLSERGSSRYGDRRTLRDDERGSGSFRNRRPGRFGGRRENRSGDRIPPGLRSTEEKKGYSAAAKEGPKTKTMSDFYDELRKVLITNKTDIYKMTEPLTMWAYDDTVEPGRTYRYRMRVGVFNPVAGTNQVSKEDEHLKDRVILWGEFSETTKNVEIPKRLYFFPKAIQEAAKMVTVEVCKYKLGYWYSEDFAVRRGEVMGKVVERKAEKNEDQESEKKITLPGKIDFSTGAVFVDVAVVNDWSDRMGSSLAQSYYSDMLYSLDGTSIDRMPIKLRYWSKNLQSRFRQIQRMLERVKKPFRAWGKQAYHGSKLIKKGAKGKEGASRRDREERAFQRMMQHGMRDD